MAFRRILQKATASALHGTAVLGWILCSVTSDEMAIPNALLVLQHPNMALSPKATSAPKPLILELVRTIAKLNQIRPGYQKLAVRSIAERRLIRNAVRSGAAM
jgi:hypothetical protein